jgi:hypothetical protein
VCRRRARRFTLVDADERRRSVAWLVDRDHGHVAREGRLDAGVVADRGVDDEPVDGRLLHARRRRFAEARVGNEQ